MFRLLAISDRRSLADLDLPSWAAALARSGVDAVQLREKDLPDRALYHLAVVLGERLAGTGSALLINGRADLALAAGARGVHLPADGVPVGSLRERWGVQLLVGRSTHSLVEVEDAAVAGADYVTFGPVYETPSKRAFGPPLGLDALAAAARIGIPVIALGGVDGGRLGEVAGAGAAGAAGIRAFTALDEVPGLVARAREVFP